MLNLCRRKSAGLVLLLGLMASNQLLAQRNNPYYDDKTIHFGFLVGYNSSTFHLQPNAARYLLNDTMTYMAPSWGPGFQLGIISDLRLAEHATLRFTPTLMFSQRNIQYSFVNPLNDIRRSLQIANVDIPLLLKFRSDRIDNFRMYAIGGFKYSIDMASQEKVVEDVQRVKIIRNDISYEIGFGFDFYLPYFKFSPEIKLAQGIRNVLVPESHVYSNPIEGLRARTIMISFNFE
jgi:hypothetical protein